MSFESLWRAQLARLALSLGRRAQAIAQYERALAADPADPGPARSLGFAVIIIVSLLTPAPDKETQALVEHVRYPHLRGDIDTTGT